MNTSGQRREPDAKEVLIQPMDKTPKAKMKKNNGVVVVVYIVLVALGLGTGYLLAGKPSVASSEALQQLQKTQDSKKIIGSTDTSAFKDCPVGLLEKGGLDGEGTHHLTREGGPSQTAYLTSSVIDLDEYVGMKVKACGETLKAKKAPWLLDIGRLELQ